MRTRELVALIWGIEAGRVQQDTRGRLSFAYDESWRGRRDAVPLSVSMPLAGRDHGHDAIAAYLWGLLPDNENVLDRWGRRFHVSPRNPFALLSHVGEECAGAVQFAAPERRDALRGPGAPEVEWLTEAEVAERLRALRQDHAAWRGPRDLGQFSLAGSQPKTALLFDGGRWGIPAGRTPTTHILKPPIEGLDGHVENEHLCLLLARAVGLPTATSEVRRFGDELVIVVARYDRVRTADLASAAETETAAHAAAAAGAAADSAGDPRAAVRAAASAAEAAASTARARALRTLAETQPILRLHQEDLCQALGVRPTFKYQNEGGPSPARIVDLLRDHSSDAEADIATFVDALAFNWLIAGTDAHAKNYSLLLAGAGRVRLAPLYDLASALPYPEMDPNRIKLAMRIGSKYRVADIRRRHWLDLAKSLGQPPDAVVARIAGIARTLEAAIPQVREQAVASGLDHPIVGRLWDLLAKQAARCSGHLASMGA